MRRAFVFVLLAGCSTVHVAPAADELFRVGRFSADQRFLWSASRFSLRFESPAGTVRARLRQTTRPPSAEGPPQPLRIRADVDGRAVDVQAVLWRQPVVLERIARRGLRVRSHHQRDIVSAPRQRMTRFHRLDSVGALEREPDVRQVENPHRYFGSVVVGL